MSRSNWLLLIPVLIVTGLAGCTKPDTKDGEKTVASFYVKDAGGGGDVNSSQSALSWQKTLHVEGDSGRASYMVTNKNPWQIPQKATFSFWACLDARGSNEPLKGQKFVIENPQTGVQFEAKGPTNDKGCLVWDETFSFNYFVRQSTNVTIVRNIVSAGVQSGKTQVQFAINPWSLGDSARDKGDGVTFLRDTVLPPTQLVAQTESAAALDGRLTGNAEVYVSKVDLTTIRRRRTDMGLSLDLTLSMKPYVKYWNLTGPDYKEIKSGRFKVVAQLVAYDVGNQENKTMAIFNPSADGCDNQSGHKKCKAWGLSNDSVDVINGDLVVSLKANLTKDAIDGNLSLAVKLIPVGLPQGNLNDFEGIFNFGDIQKLNGGSGILRDDCRQGQSSCSVANYIKGTTNFEELKRVGDATGYEPYIFSGLKLRFQYVKAGETATQRTVSYSAQTCVTDHLTGEKVRGKEFTIQYLDANKKILPDQVIHKTTSPDGCLIWDASVFHKYYQPEVFFQKIVKITGATGAGTTLTFYLNPWDDKFTFGFNEYEFPSGASNKVVKDFGGGKNNLAEVQKNSIPARFYLPQFSYHTIRFLYSIDKYMNLEVKKTILLDLAPRVLRYSAIVNARKQTEPLRDGIYLLKVAIEKRYLDPAESKLVITPKSKRPGAGMIYATAGVDGQPKELDSRDFDSIPKKEFITTSTQLVRVVDGRLIQPIELTMRDLRLMRIRSNFLIELQTVDERAVEAHQVLAAHYKEDIAKIEEDRKQKEKLRQSLEDKSDAETQKTLEEQRAEIKKTYQNVFYGLTKHLRSHSNIVDLDFTKDGKDATQEQETFERLLQPLVKVLSLSDFTKIVVPKNVDVDLNQFVDDNSGLAKRTFVGPVIFLSNAYSDSMRPTDNIDEAGCTPDEEGKTPEQILADNQYKSMEDSEFLSTEKQLDGSRQNQAYFYSPYYGSLSHLCNAKVDQLIDREKKMQEEYDKVMPLTASLENFVRYNGVKYLALNPEDPGRFDHYCSMGDKDGCAMVKSRYTPAGELLQKLNQPEISYPVYGLPREIRDRDSQKFNINDLRRWFLSNQDTPERTFGLCSVLAIQTAQELSQLPKDQRYSGWWSRHTAGMFANESNMAGWLFNTCFQYAHRNGTSPFFVDDKLHVEQTNGYRFLGGFQLNLNVGKSFSIGQSMSDGYSLDYGDIVSSAVTVAASGLGAVIGTGLMPGAGTAVGAMEGAAAGGILGKMASDVFYAILKPNSLKSSWGNSSGNGTSVSESTYLVSQMARFNVTLGKYETCNIIRFKDDLADEMVSRLGVNENLKSIILAGTMACEGPEVQHPRRDVEEWYFYFTQHFTEGDMLDQADIYNHPWLLAMRGPRDFGTFVTSIQAQGEASLRNIFGGQDDRQDWPLAKLSEGFRMRVPSFPGFYTVLNRDEMMTNYPFADYVGRTDMDPNHEVTCELQGGHCIDPNTGEIKQN